MLEHLGLAVNRLIRVSFGPFELGDLGEGELAEVRTRVLRDQLGAKLAREAGVDFDAPVVERALARPAPPEGRAPAVRESSQRGRTGGGRDRGEEPRGRGARGAQPTRPPPAPSQPERRRKHVSALRAEIAADTAGPRRRIERSATHDRKGRTVAVERISLTAEEAGKRAAAVTRAPRKAKGSATEERRALRSEPKRELAERPRRARFVRGEAGPRRGRTRAAAARRVQTPRAADGEAGWPTRAGRSRAGPRRGRGTTWSASAAGGSRRAGRRWASSATQRRGARAQVRTAEE